MALDDFHSEDLNTDQLNDLSKCGSFADLLCI
jgi:hypothetical protein